MTRRRIHVEHEWYAPCPGQRPHCRRRVDQAAIGRCMCQRNQLDRVIQHLVQRIDGDGAIVIAGHWFHGKTMAVGQLQHGHVIVHIFTCTDEDPVPCPDAKAQNGPVEQAVPAPCGIVEKGNRTARIIDKPRVIEVPAKEKDGELW